MLDIVCLWISRSIPIGAAYPDTPACGGGSSAPHSDSLRDTPLAFCYRVLDVVFFGR